MHEWLHGVVSLLELDEEKKSPDLASEYGFKKPPYLNFYKALMKNELTTESRQTGITNELWQNYKPTLTKQNSLPTTIPVTPSVAQPAKK
ncbi:MAG: hypothetical protein ABI844_08540 [Saprospiraceae bacterium]